MIVKKEEWGRGNERDSLGTFGGNFDMYFGGWTVSLSAFPICIAAAVTVFIGIRYRVDDSPLGE